RIKACKEIPLRRETMKHIKKLTLALTLALMFAGSTFAGETGTPPCPQPLPGETGTPPCDGGSATSDPSTSTFTAAATNVPDEVSFEVLVCAIDTVLTAF